MNKDTTLVVAILLLLLVALASGCNKLAQAEADSHAGHDHAAEEAAADPHAGHDHAAEQPAEDPHAGHDHAAEEAADDPHAGHDHAAEEAADDPHAGHDHAAEEAADDPHAGHDHEGEEAAGITLTAEQIRELGIASAPAGPGELGHDLELTGEVTINEDRVTHVVPRVGGIITKVYHSLGDHVSKGSALLELDSIELSNAKSEYLALLSQLELAEKTLKREEMLLDKGISAEQDYLEARQSVDGLLIEKASLERNMLALGLTTAQIDMIPGNPEAGLTKYTVYSPVGGEIIEKHASLGELVSSESDVFTIGDLSSVWVRLNIHQKDYVDVREGLEVLIDAGHGIEPVLGRIDYIEPIIGEETRTAVARVVLSRSSHLFRPGLFVTGYIEVEGEEAGIVLPRSAVVDLDQDKLAFVRHGLSFEPVVVTIGRETAAKLEILSGINPGDEVVVEGVFQLKAELLKGTFDPHAGHAH